MNKGYVYVLTNESMPGIVKVGKTTRCPWDRAEELWTTGVPTPFRVHFAILTDDCDDLERGVHHGLRQHRVESSREFFKYSPDDAAFAVSWTAWKGSDRRAIVPEEVEAGLLRVTRLMSDGLNDNLDPETALDALSHMAVEDMEVIWGRYAAVQTALDDVSDENPFAEEAAVAH